MPSKAGPIWGWLSHHKPEVTRSKLVGGIKPTFFLIFISISFQFSLPNTYNRKLKLKYSTIKHAALRVKSKLPSYNIIKVSSKSHQFQTCFPVYSHHPSSHPKTPPKISPGGHTPQTEPFVVHPPVVEKNITPTNMTDFAYLKMDKVTTPKISSKTTNISSPEVTIQHFHTTTQSLLFITHTLHTLLKSSYVEDTSLSNSPQPQPQPQTQTQRQPQTQTQTQTQRQNPHHNNPTTHFHATCLTK